MVNLPNAVTISRLLAIPVLMVLLVLRFPYHDQISALIFLVASLTDTVDGNLARVRGQVTELGKFLDPLADKLFVLSVLIVLVQEGLLPAWIVIVIFSRELVITVLRSIRADRGVVAATPFGKTKTVLQVLAVLLLILQRPYPVLQLPATIVIWAAVLFTVASGIDYLWRYRRVWWGDESPDGAAPSTEPGSARAPDPLARQIGERLAAAGLRVAVAESCTGGLLGATFTDLPGSSAWFNGGVIAYSNRVKHEQLGVPEDLLARHGAVSAEVARAMAEGVRRLLHADFGIAVTGIAGPGADGTDKPVGLTHIWLEGRGQSEGRRFVFGGDRWENRRLAVHEALTLVLERVLSVDATNKRS